MKQLKLESGAFNQELLTLIGKDKIGWHSDDHELLVNALLARLLDEDDERLKLKDNQGDIVKLVLCPTEELQRKVLKQTFTAAGYELDKKTESAFVLLLNVVQFGDYLAKTENPGTKQPFLIKPKKGGKKKTFDALLAEQPETEEAPTPVAPKKKPVKPAQEAEE